MTRRQDCLARDAADPLGNIRSRFSLPEGRHYLDGNSLGALPHLAADAVRAAVEREWGDDLIASWNKHGWIGLPQAVGAKVARLIGAAADEVVAADSVSVNLFKLAAAALGVSPERRVVVTEAGDFPTDLYILQGLAGLRPDVELRVVAPGGIEAALDERVAVVLLSHVHYRSGAVRDMAGLNAAIRRAGALSLWDLSHSAGVLDVDLNRDGADLAAGCGYKYLNGGPGAPAWLFVAGRHQATLRNPLSGWMGHARPFEFSDDYAPAAGIDRWLCGTPPVLSLKALNAALDVFSGVDMGMARAKAGALGDLFIERVEARCGGKGLTLACPREAAARGGQVSFSHPNGWAIMQNLIARGVVGDFRAPDIIRFGFSPLYVRFADVWDSVEIMGEILDSESWRDPRFEEVAAVT